MTARRPSDGHVSYGCELASPARDCWHAGCVGAAEARQVEVAFGRTRMGDIPEAGKALRVW
jgi:hypothetical protein